jgi:hypothetical protein
LIDEAKALVATLRAATVLLEGLAMYGQVVRDNAWTAADEALADGPISLEERQAMSDWPIPPEERLSS